MANTLSASYIINLKNRVRNEMLRRNQIGSLVSYGGSAYDYSSSEMPRSGGLAMPVHVTKLTTPLSAIRSTTVAGVASGATWKSLAGIDAAITTFASASMTSGADCSTSCSGLCRGQCNTGCSGCSGGCSGCRGCGGACSNNCRGGCEGGCDGCSGSCESSCRGGCEGNCGGACSSGCTGCRGGCAGTCDNGCRGVCSSGCSSQCIGCQGND